ncbi:MAG: glycosyltransferase family 2 protein [Prevotella sp.]
MKHKILSIIIPTYNMEGYLAKCLESFIINDRRERIEAIVVNDGSTDNSLSIARDFESKYPEMFRIIDKPNGNYGSCINSALKIATGKYVKILDADDTFDSNHFPGFVDLLERIDVDLVLNDKVEIYRDRECLESIDYPVGMIDVFFRPETMKSFKSITMHSITYRLSILKAMGYVQSEGIFYTDTEWAFAPMAFVNTAYYQNIPLYRYLLAREGQSVDSKVMDAHLKDEILVTIRNVNNIASFSAQPKIVLDTMRYRLYRQIRRLYKRIIIKSPYLDGDILMLLDDELRKKDVIMYKKIGKETKYGIKYINIWRKNRKNPLLKFIIKTFRLIG